MVYNFEYLTFLSTSQIYTVVLATFSAIIYIWWIASWKTNFVRLIEAIPGPKCRLILGHTLDIAFTPYEDLFRCMNWLCCSYGQHTSLSRIWLGNHAYVAVTRAEALQAIMSSTHHLNKSHDYAYLHPWLGLGLLTSTGKLWHSRRKLLTPTFHMEILDQFVDIFNEQANILVRNLQKHEGKGKLNIYNLLTHCTLDIICETAMGTNVNAQGNSDSDYVKAVAEMGRIFYMRISRPWLQANWMFNLTKWKTIQNHQLEVLHSFTKQVIKDRKQRLAEQTQILQNDPHEISSDKEVVMGQKKRLAFLDMLLNASVNNEKLSLNDIQQEVDTFMFEGHDTTTSGLSSIILLLGHHPEVQARVQEELDTVIGNSSINTGSNDLKKLKYLEAVIKESMRLYPPVPIIGRHLKDDIIMDGYRVPAGTDLLLNVYLAHRDPEMFPDPEKFDPDRFLLENPNGKRHPYSYLPFSAGPRNCIGQKFAMMELKTVLSKVLLRFNFKSHMKLDEIKFFTQPILRSFDGIIVSIEPREL